MPLHLDVAAVRYEIEALIASCPELADDETLRADMLEAETDLNAILLRLLNKEREANAMVAGCKLRADEIAERKARYTRQKDSVRATIKSLMEAGDLRKVSLPEATLSIAKARSRCEIENAADLPQGYFETVRKPDTNGIKKALEAGETIPGARLTIGEESLTVRAT